jgi:mannose-1-phosphate guanylyltransferase
MTGSSERRRLWAIVLAGGDGVRMRESVRRWIGTERPKQYCTFVGTRSMFQHTVDRAALLTAPERVVIVAGRHHQRDVWMQLDDRASGLILLQPANLDTAAGVLLPLTYILARDPDATVAVFPSDHFVYPEDRFIENVEQAVRGCELLSGRPILLAIKPDSAESEYGWIQPGKRLAASLGHEIRSIRSFVEKPGEAQARMMMAAGGLWNTMVLVSKARSLWELGESMAPKLTQLFGGLRHAIDKPEESQVLDRIYAAMPKRNFSADLLARVPERLAVMELRDILWSDWGNPRRITHMLTKIGRRPAFAEGF